MNLYAYAPNPTGWVDPLGLARIKNAVKGDRRHQEFNAKIREKYPDATIQCECYLRNAQGQSVKDPDTGERRRIDTAVIESGEAQTFEVTSLTANKVDQIAKEGRVRLDSGTYIRDRTTKELVPVKGVSIIERVE